MALTNIGVDSNVFNSEGEPERDFTATVSPGVDSWFRVGAAQLSVRTTLDWTYFRRSADQRSLGLSEEGRFDLLFNRLNPYAIGSYITTRRRPNLEIDARVRQKQQELGVGTQARLGARLTLDAVASHSFVDFSDAEFGSELIADALNRESRRAAIAARFALTPLTTLTVQSALEQDRFERDGLRDSNSLLILPGLAMEPSALVSGRVEVGMRRFEALAPDVPDFTGLVASTDVSYIAREMTRFSISVSRDVDYSIDQDEPYLVVTTGGLTVTQVIGFNWFVVGRVARSQLTYKALSGVSAESPGDGRRDYATTLGAGVARRLGADLRVGLDVDHVSRRSPVDGRDYEGYRLGGSITYGTN